LKQADEVICLTQYLLDNLKKEGIRRNDVKIIPWGIDTSLFAFNEKSLSHPVKFLHIANLSPVKDQTTLLNAFKIIVDQAPSHLTIIGEGSAEQSIRKLASDLNIEDKVTFKGLMPYEDLVLYYHQADVLLHTSLSEGQSEVVTEAMSCGVLVCGTKVGLLYDQPGCCISVPVQNADRLGQEVLKVLNDAQRIHALKQNACAWSLAHSIYWTTEEISKLYQLLAKPESGAD
jgi:glycosyltransferase involved in cell wall biosynthesis